MSGLTDIYISLIKQRKIRGSPLGESNEKEHKPFFAIPFDSATFTQYQRITKRLRDKYPAIKIVIGSKEVGPSERYSRIATFKAQNRDLHRQFTRQIAEADVVIADLTNNNANVHMELGIALMQNKNILRVTGRSHSDAPFDIRQLEIETYQDEGALLRLLAEYLDMFFRIKRLEFDSENEPFYSKPVLNLKMEAMSHANQEQCCVFDAPRQLVIRDGAVRARFSIMQSLTPSDWFGICFRVGDSVPWMGSHVYVRQDGSIDLATYPGPQVRNLIPAS